MPITRPRIQTDNPFVKEIRERVDALNDVLTRAYQVGVKANIEQDYAHGNDTDEFNDDPLYLYKVTEVVQVIYDK